MQSSTKQIRLMKSESELAFLHVSAYKGHDSRFNIAVSVLAGKKGTQLNEDKSLK